MELETKNSGLIYKINKLKNIITIKSILKRNIKKIIN
jgi:hypothetical protein